MKINQIYVLKNFKLNKQTNKITQFQTYIN